MTTPLRHLVKSALPAALLVLISASEATAQTERRALMGRDVSIYDPVGSVTVEPGSGSDVTVEITRRGADAKRLSIDVSRDGGGDRLRVVFPDDDIVYPEMGRWSNYDYSYNGDRRGSGSWRDWFGRDRIRVKGYGRGTEAWADVRIMVPPGKRVDVHVAVGTLKSSNVNADLALDGSSARVSVAGHTGPLHVSTGSGGADIRDVKGEDLRVSCGSGRVMLSGADVKIADIETGSGGVTVDRIAAPELNVHAGSGGMRVERATADRVRLTTGSGGANIELTNSPASMDVHSGSGYVTLTLPSNLDAELSVSTGSGSIDTDFAVQVSRMYRRELRGTVGKGTGRIYVETGSGGVRLRRA